MGIKNNLKNLKQVEKIIIYENKNQDLIKSQGENEKKKQKKRLYLYYYTNQSYNHFLVKKNLRLWLCHIIHKNYYQIFFLFLE